MFDVLVLFFQIKRIKNKILHFSSSLSVSKCVKCKIEWTRPYLYFVRPIKINHPKTLSWLLKVLDICIKVLADVVLLRQKQKV